MKEVLLNVLAYYGIGALIALVMSICMVVYDIKYRHVLYTRKKIAEEILYMTAWSFVTVVIGILILIEKVLLKLIRLIKV